MEAFSAVAAAEDLHVEDRIEEHVPQVALGIPDIDGEALRTAHVFAGGILFHVFRVRLV
jgi:hypothetical protein